MENIHTSPEGKLRETGQRAGKKESDAEGTRIHTSRQKTEDEGKNQWKKIAVIRNPIRGVHATSGGMADIAQRLCGSV